MIDIKEKEKCCGCAACVQSCPQNCIDFKKDNEGFFYPNVDTSRCIGCSRCEKVCPFLSNNEYLRHNPKVVGAKAKDDDIRYWSSSGGIFTLIAKYILKMHGVVYGAEMNEDCSFVRHVAVDNEKDLHKLRGSKYIQSRIANSYAEVEKFLQKGKCILFTGTPCQINGLKMFLGKDYERLYCVEVICHGVPSEKLWRSYLSYIERKYQRKVKKVEFRSKKYSWKNYGNDISFEKSRIFKFSFEDSFFRMFNSSYSMRPSCYKCKAKGNYTMADMTIGDFWGIEKVLPDFDDNRGVSIVLLNTEKGEFLFEHINNEISLSNKYIDYETALKCNPPIAASIEYTSKRKQFFEDLEGMPFYKLQRKYTPMGPRRKWKVIKTKFLAKIEGTYGVLITLDSKEVLK